jgi:hypothetical protein
MHLFVCEHKVSTAAVQNALSRSALLRDMHRDDPEGCVHMPCDTGTWTAWLDDDLSQMTADAMELMLAVIKVRVLYTQESWMLACCQLKHARPRSRSAGCNRRYAAKLLYQANVNAHGIFFQIEETAAGFSRNTNNSPPRSPDADHNSSTRGHGNCVGEKSECIGCRQKIKSGHHRYPHVYSQYLMQMSSGCAGR